MLFRSAGVKFQRDAVRIGGAQRAAHEGADYPSHGQALGGKENMRRVKISFGEDFEAKDVNGRIVRFAQNNAVVAAFLHRAQVDGARVLMGDVQAKHIRIKRAARGEVGHSEFDVA